MLKKKLIPKGQDGLLKGIRRAINKAGDYYKLFTDAMTTPYTTTALDEMGHPIMEVNSKGEKRLVLRTSTPSKDVKTSVTSIELPISVVKLGIPTTIAGIVGGAATGKIGSNIARKSGELLGVDSNAQEMLGDIGGFIGSIPGEGIRIRGVRPSVNHINRLLLIFRRP